MLMIWYSTELAFTFGGAGFVVAAYFYLSSSTACLEAKLVALSRLSEKLKVEIAMQQQDIDTLQQRLSSASSLHKTWEASGDEKAHECRIRSQRLGRKP